MALTTAIRELDLHWPTVLTPVSAVLAIGCTLVALFLFVLAVGLAFNGYYWFAYPIVGNVLQFGPPEEYADKLQEIMTTWGKDGIFRSWLGIFPNVEIYEPDLIATIVSSSKHFEKAPLYRLLVPWLGTGLLISGGAKWKARRRLITPAFHFGILKSFVATMNERTNVMLQLLKPMAERNDVVDFSSMVTKLTLDIICETAMGKHLDAQSKGNSVPYVRAVYSIARSILRRIRLPWMMSDTIFHLTPSGAQWRRDLRVLHGFVYDVIRERRQRLAGSPGKLMNGTTEQRPAFLDLLLSSTDEQTGQPLTDEGIEEETSTFMFEGHVYVIGQEAHIQARLQEEIDALLDGRDSSDLSMDDLNDLTYLDRFCKEALRLYPSVPFISRAYAFAPKATRSHGAGGWSPAPWCQILTEDVNMRGVLIPKDQMITIQILPLQRNPKLWTNPLQFDPDRWLNEGDDREAAYKYIPFSAGPRSCIGQRFAQIEEKIVLAKLIRHFHIDTVDRDIKGLAELVYRPAAPIRIRVRQRRPLQ